jgi:hypothetical protein
MSWRKVQPEHVTRRCDTHTTVCTGTEGRTDTEADTETKSECVREMDREGEGGREREREREREKERETHTETSYLDNSCTCCRRGPTSAPSNPGKIGRSAASLWR